ncbi:FAD-binding protein, partial [Planctomycetota bacterium]
ADYLRLRADVAVSAGSLAVLGRRRGLPQSSLAESVDEFNRYASGSAPDPWGRTADTEPLKGDRWVLLGPAKAYFTTTEGGASVNQQMQVLDQSGQPIEGLYAAGQTGLGGMILWGHGLHIAWALTSGRLVGLSLTEGYQRR